MVLEFGVANVKSAGPFAIPPLIAEEEIDPGGKLTGPVVTRNPPLNDASPVTRNPPLNDTSPSWIRAPLKFVSPLTSNT